MRLLRHILTICLALGLIAGGLSPGHALRCASDAGAAAMASSAHRHTDATAHHAAPAIGHSDGVTAASPDHAVDHGDHRAAGPICNCGCLSLCAAAMGVAPARVEALERRTIAIRYAVIAQVAPDGIQFIDPGIPIRAA